MNRASDFNSWQSSHIPLQLVNRRFIIWFFLTANARLQEAKRWTQTCCIDFQENCLPYWSGRGFNHNEKVGDTIQDRLVSLNECRTVGKFVREQIIFKSRRLMLEASRLHVKLEDIYIGPSLLPVWGEKARVTIEFLSQRGFSTEYCMDRMMFDDTDDLTRREHSSDNHITGPLPQHCTCPET